MKFEFKDTNLIVDKELENIAGKLDHYITYLNKEVLKKPNYAFPESSIYLPSDNELLEKTEKLSNKKTSRTLKYHFVIGIGGSNLGTKAIYEASFLFHDLYDRHSYPKTFFLDTDNARELEEALAFIDREIHIPDEFLITVVTKSGTTTETAVHLELLYESLGKKFEEHYIDERVVAITNEGSKLDDIARKRKIDVLNIPELVGGRYSVFSAVGIYPLVVSGISVGELRKNAAHMRERCLIRNIKDNPALASAAILFTHLRARKNIHDTFLFSKELESLGKWYRQLMAESLGKEENKEGKDVREGMTPTVTIGSTDLHSMAQLYLGGPKDKVTTFVWFEHGEDVKMPDKQSFNLVDGLDGKSSRIVMRAIYKGTKEAYKKDANPYMEVVLEGLGDIGAFMQFKMMEVMFLGQLLNVSAFDQPAVEKYKEITREILGS